MCRYAYHIRRWAQSGASVCGSNIEGSPLKVIIQPGGVNVKASLDMHNTDYIADLRAQITIWWEQQVKMQYNFKVLSIYMSILIFQIQN